MPLTDADLIHYASTGHKEAFAELIRRYQGFGLRSGVSPHRQFYRCGRHYAGSDVRCLVMGIGEQNAAEATITLWMHKADMDAFAHAPLEVDMSTGALKERAFDTLTRILRALGAEVKQVVLCLSGTDQCQAVVVFTRGGIECTVDMRPSDALCLTNLMPAPIYAEEAVVRKGHVGEAGISTPESGEQTVTEEHKAEYRMHWQAEDLLSKAFDLGLSPEEWLDTVRYRVDEADGTLHLWLEALPDHTLRVPLSEYAAGIERLFTWARNREQRVLHCGGGKNYTRHFAMLGEEARVRFVQES